MSAAPAAAAASPPPPRANRSRLPAQNTVSPVSGGRQAAQRRAAPGRGDQRAQHCGHDDVCTRVCVCVDTEWMKNRGGSVCVCVRRRRRRRTRAAVDKGPNERAIGEERAGRRRRRWRTTQRTQRSERTQHSHFTKSTLGLVSRNGATGAMWMWKLAGWVGESSV